jgi:uncharacterized membrane protein YecN with MAPEG domain
MRITGLYAALLALLILGLAIRVMWMRNHHRVALGDGGNVPLTCAIRTHANAIEYVPIGLILLLILELNQTQPMLLHGFGLTLLVGRVLHALGLSRQQGRSAGRAVGALLTMLAIVGMAVLLLWQFVLVRTISG